MKRWRNITAGPCERPRRQLLKLLPTVYFLLKSTEPSFRSCRSLAPLPAYLNSVKSSTVFEGFVWRPRRRLGLFSSAFQGRFCMKEVYISGHTVSHKIVFKFQMPTDLSVVMLDFRHFKCDFDAVNINRLSMYIDRCEKIN